MKLVLLSALVAALLPVTAGASTRAAQVSVVSRSPVIIQGTGFRAREVVVVTVSSKVARTKKVIATRRGAFRATFTAISFAYCQPYAVRAKGNRGSTAFVKVIPECPAPGPSG